MRNVLMRRFIRHRGAFTLLEMMVSIAVLTIIVLIVSQLLSSATTITTMGNKHMDADNQARAVLDRMTQDFNQIVKRADVDYFLKQPSNPETGQNKNTGKNDQLSFFSQVEGYYPTSSQSHLSLVSYRVNSSSGTPGYNKLERLGKGLAWNGDLSGNTPIVFSPLTIAAMWPNATTSNGVDSDYELVGPQIFRFEYYYQLQQGDLTDTPWDDINQTHTSIQGLRDVGAIVVVIAVIDPKSRVLLSDSQLVTLAGQMLDYVPYNSPGNSGKVGPQPQVQWQDAVNSSTIPRAAATGIRFYQRYFYLNGQQQ
jgi:prepilin-type N-terminal cleavage/methylation domain-containing protein